MPLSAIRRIVAGDLTPVFYHSFTGSPIPHIAPLFPCKSPGDLERDLLYLKSHFRLVSHDDIVFHREKGRRFPSNAAAVSFDDGFIECFTVATPLLFAHGIPATFFVCKIFIDNQSLMFGNKIALCVALIADSMPVDLSRCTAVLRARLG